MNINEYKKKLILIRLNKIYLKTYSKYNIQ